MKIIDNFYCKMRASLGPVRVSCQDFWLNFTIKISHLKYCAVHFTITISKLIAALCIDRIRILVWNLAINGFRFSLRRNYI